MPTTATPVTHSLGSHYGVTEALNRFRTKIAPTAVSQIGHKPSLLQLNGGAVAKVKVEIESAEGDANLKALRTLLKNAFPEGTLTQHIHLSQDQLTGLRAQSVSEAIVGEALEKKDFKDEKLFFLAPYLLQVETGFDISKNKLITDVRILKVEPDASGENYSVKPFTGDEIKVLQSYNIFSRLGIDQVGPGSLSYLTTSNDDLSASLSIPAKTIRSEEIYIVETRLVGKADPVSFDADPGNDLRDLKTLVEQVFLTKGSGAAIDLGDKLNQLGNHVRTDTKNQDVVFSREVGKYKLTVKGQIPRAEGKGGKNVVLVVDVDKADNSKFNETEKELLRSYSFKLRYRDPSSTGKLRDSESKEVIFSEQAKRNSMSVGFWPTYAYGGRIQLNLFYDYHKGEKHRIAYKTEVLDDPKDIDSSKKINLDLAVS